MICPMLVQAMHRVASHHCEEVQRQAQYDCRPQFARKVQDAVEQVKADKRLDMCTLKLAVSLHGDL